MQHERAMTRRATIHRLRRQAAGFTLVELMAVVVIAGILATVATYGMRKYILAAKTSEATAFIGQIKAAEEAYRDEMFAYVGLSNFDVWHPTDDPGLSENGWLSNTTNAQYTDVFRPLGVMPSGAVQYSYAVVAGNAGDTLPTIPLSGVTIPAPTEQFYIVMAKADLDGDGTPSYMLGYSESSKIVSSDNF